MHFFLIPPDSLPTDSVHALISIRMGGCVCAVSSRRQVNRRQRRGHLSPLLPMVTIELTCARATKPTSRGAETPLRARHELGAWRLQTCPTVLCHCSEEPFLGVGTGAITGTQKRRAPYSGGELGWRARADDELLAKRRAPLSGSPRSSNVTRPCVAECSRPLLARRVGKRTSDRRTLR